MNIGGVNQARIPQRTTNVQAGGGELPVMQPTAPVLAPAPAMPTAAAPAQAQSVFAQLFTGIANFLKGVISWFANLFKGGTTGTGTTSTGTTPPLDAQSAAIAAQYGLLATQPNVQAFLAEVNGYAAAGVLGPGSANVQAVKDLQTALARLGYPVQASGQYDQATIMAVRSFKQASGITQTYRMADGTPAVNEYADAATVNAIRARLAGQPVTPTTPTTPTAPTQPAAAWQAIATQYHLQPSEANVNTFLAEVKQYQVDGALGPGSTQTQPIKDLQTVLAKWGYPVQATGQYDAATSQAVIAFKTANGLHQGYLAADGKYAVNEYAEKQTLNVIMAKLQAQMVPPSTPVQVPPANQVQVPPSNPVQVPPSNQVQATGMTSYQTIAGQYHLAPDAANVNAFLAEVKQYQVDGALGPGSNQTQPIRDLQTVLAKWGFPVQATGQFDAATAQAVIAYKRQQGLHQTYRAADGNWAVNEYADKTTLQSIMSRLQAQMKKAS